MGFWEPEVALSKQVSLAHLPGEQVLHWELIFHNIGAWPLE
jgi:hypothetical protein